jgi:hypothetical protein
LPEKCPASARLGADDLSENCPLPSSVGDRAHQQLEAVGAAQGARAQPRRFHVVHPSALDAAKEEAREEAEDKAKTDFAATEAKLIKLQAERQTERIGAQIKAWKAEGKLLPAKESVHGEPRRRRFRIHLQRDRWHPDTRRCFEGFEMKSLAIDYTVSGGQNRAERRELIIYSWIGRRSRPG